MQEILLCFGVHPLDIIYSLNKITNIYMKPNKHPLEKFKFCPAYGSEEFKIYTFKSKNVRNVNSIISIIQQELYQL